MSTFCTSYIYHKCATLSYKKGTIIADDADNTNNLFNMIKKYYDFFPPKVRPHKRYSNRKAIVFENPSDEIRESDRPQSLFSRIEVETAKKARAGMSGTIQYLHCSEFAFWDNAASVVTSMFQSVPYERETAIFIESTANGMGGKGEEFYNRWQAAEAGDSSFIPIFLPWYDEPAYQLPIVGEFIPTEIESDYMRRFNIITPEKLMWRRYKIANEMGSALMSPVDQFKQEYPAYPEEAFIASGRTVFDVEQVVEDIERIKNVTFKRGEFDGEGRFHERSNGAYKLYGNKDSRATYAIGADVAEGLETGDFSAAFAIDRAMEQRLSYHAHIAPDLFGKELCKMGDYFNKALLAPEINNHGHATMAAIV